MKCLGLCMIAAACLESQGSHGAVPRILGRVECSNPSPIRHLLLNIGFAANGRKAIAATSKPGMQHMPQQGGNVCVDEFEFQQVSLCSCLRATEQYRDSGILSSKYTVAIEVHSLKANRWGDPLKETLSQQRCPP